MNRGFRKPVAANTLAENPGGQVEDDVLRDCPPEFLRHDERGGLQTQVDFRSQLEGVPRIFLGVHGGWQGDSQQGQQYRERLHG